MRSEEFDKGFVGRRHAQLRAEYQQEALATLHAHVDVWHSHGFHDFTPEHQQGLWAADAENDPGDFAPRRGATPHRACTWCRDRGLPKGKR